MGRVLVEIEDPEGYPDPRTVHCGVQSAKLSLHSTQGRRSETFVSFIIRTLRTDTGYTKRRRIGNREDQVHIWKKIISAKNLIKTEKMYLILFHDRNNRCKKSTGDHLRKIIQTSVTCTTS
jgi:hypothetical protein